MREIQPALARLMARATGVDADIENLARLSGGANMESSAFSYAGEAYVLRRSPSLEFMAGRPNQHAVEAAVVRAAFEAGVKAPEIIGEIIPDDDIGTGYVMRRVVAEVNPAKILAAPPPSLLGDLARELGRIHKINYTTLPELDEVTPASVLADLKARFIGYGGDRPVFAMAFRWLEDKIPGPVDPVLIHGDFRMGNVMVDADGLAAVLDWELVHLGDRHQDLAYGCINSWRFGHIEKPAFGCGSLEEYWAAYEAECGVPVDPARFRWWHVYCTLWWGVCCLQMAQIWRSGMDASLERAVIGRRASETEADLLMLLEDDAPENERGPIAIPDPEPVRRSGEPSAVEMMEALAAWIEKDVKPKADGRDRFMANVALNALGMLKREAEAPVLIHDKALSEALLAGEHTIATPGLFTRFKTETLAKLAVDQPKYSALAAIQKKWRA
ncbi:MAG TPA: phosphotransferase [Chakrabartia sp.]|nr:phosphotransferase [Chakrabartia sp.]